MIVLHIPPLIDPDFDEMAAEVTIKELIDLEPQIYERPDTRLYARTAIARHHYNTQRKRRVKQIDKIEHELRQAQFELRTMVDRYDRVEWRFRYYSAQLNPKCNKCRPYNGSHTPNYWGTNQRDPW